MKAGGQMIVILLLALIPTAITAAFHPRRPSWTEMRPGEVSLERVQAWGKSILWVDARSPAEYEIEHLPEAINLSLDDWENALPAFLDRWTSEKKVVVYCSSTSCELSHEVAERLKQNGVSEVFVLHGGWEALRPTLKVP